MERIAHKRLAPPASARCALAALAVALAAAANAAWYWPFDPDSTNKPPRLHRLMEKANDYIDMAEDESFAGNGDKAIENYNKAIAELDRVERENPERAETTEFAPLRTKRATCQSAIDAIRFAQVNDNERAVCVTDTTELQKKWNRKHGVKTPEDEEDERRRAEEAAAKAAAPKPEDAAFLELYSAARADLAAKRYDDAEARLAELDKMRADDLYVLLMRSALQVCRGRDFAARRTLERAVRLHGDSYLPLYNLARLSLKIDDDVDAAKRNYDKGRALGGPRDEALERRFAK